VKKIEHILVATDFSPRADRAVRRGAQLAKEHGAKLDLLHVLPILTFEALRRLKIDIPLETEQQLYNHAKATLQEMATSLSSGGISVMHHVAIGQAHVKINQYANSNHADLIVIGDQGETFAREFFLGTTASKTLSKGSRPLLVVKQEPKGEYKHVLVPMDFSQPSLDALEVALKAGTRASIYALHVAEVPFAHRMKQMGLSEERADLHRDNLLSHAHAEMEKIAEGCARGDAQVTFIVEQGRPRVVILQQVRALHIDLVVIGKRGETELDEALFGSVTKHVLYETSCDVLVASAGLLKQSEKDDLGGKHS
jgi:universal stress protein E